jgi:hypothetical protein
VGQNKKKEKTNVGRALVDVPIMLGYSWTKNMVVIESRNSWGAHCDIARSHAANTFLETIDDEMTQYGRLRLVVT